MEKQFKHTSPKKVYGCQIRTSKDAQENYSLGNINWDYQLHCIAWRVAEVESIDHTSVGVKVEKLELLYISGGNVKLCNYFENSSNLLKSKQTPLILFRIPLQVLLPKRTYVCEQTHISRKTCTK